jgi:hypothetical protein
MLTNTEVNDLINATHRIAMKLDEEVHDRALDCGLTERAEFLVDLTDRQKLVRVMVRVTHELNSLLGDPWDEPIPDDRQPTSYANP